MDKISLRILAELERDGRQSLVRLSDMVGLSKTPCWSRVQTLEKTGVITGYHAEVAPAALGMSVAAYVQVMIDFGQRDAFEAAALAHPAVMECTTTAGEADYLLKVVARDVGDLDDLLRFDISLLPGTQRSTTMICMKTIKRRGSIVEAMADRDRALHKGCV